MYFQAVVSRIACVHCMLYSLYMLVIHINILFAKWLSLTAHNRAIYCTEQVCVCVRQAKDLMLGVSFGSKSVFDDPYI